MAKSCFLSCDRDNYKKDDCFDKLFSLVEKKKKRNENDAKLICG